MQKTSRQRIIEYLDNRETVTAGEIALAFRITAANARHHLSGLVDDGVIIIVGGMKGGGVDRKSKTSRRGRPEQIYRLYRKAQSHNLEQLSGALLDIIPVCNISEYIHLLGHKLSGGIVEGKTSTIRLQQIVKRLNVMNYQARWEAHIDAPRVIFDHCPYFSILHKHPELCMMDKSILEEMSGGKVSQIAHQEEVRPGILQCVFKIAR